MFKELYVIFHVESLTHNQDHDSLMVAVSYAYPN